MYQACMGNTKHVWGSTKHVWEYQACIGATFTCKYDSTRNLEAQDTMRVSPACGGGGLYDFTTCTRGWPPSLPGAVNGVCLWSSGMRRQGRSGAPCTSGRFADKRCHGRMSFFKPAHIHHMGFGRGLGCVLGYLQTGAKLRTQRTQPKKGGELLPMVRRVAPIRFRVGER